MCQFFLEMAWLNKDGRFSKKYSLPKEIRKITLWEVKFYEKYNILHFFKGKTLISIPVIFNFFQFRPYEIFFYQFHP